MPPRLPNNRPSQHCSKRQTRSCSPMWCNARCRPIRNGRMSLPDSATLTRTMTIDVRGRRTERLLGMLALLGCWRSPRRCCRRSRRSGGDVFRLCRYSRSAGRTVAAGMVGRRAPADRICWLADGRWLLTDARTSGHARRICWVGSRWSGSRWLWLTLECRRIRSAVRCCSFRVIFRAADLRRLVVRLRLAVHGVLRMHDRCVTMKLDPRHALRSACSGALCRGELSRAALSL